MDFYFEKYEISTNEILMTATFLDPSFKRLSFLDLSIANDKQMHKEFMKAAKKQIESKNILVPTPPEKDDEKKGLGLSDTENETVHCTLSAEIKEYVSMPRSNLNFNDFYSKYSDKFYKISKSAVLFLFSPATSVPSERLFSHASFQVT